MSTLATVKQLSEIEPVFTESKTRWIIFKSADPESKYAKFAPAISREAGGVLIDVPLFLAIAKGRGVAGSTNS